MISKYTASLNSLAIFDPAIATRNIGDEIISQAARRELQALVPDAFHAFLPTHERLGKRSWRFSRQARYRIVAGSNILTDKLPFDRQWRLRWPDLIAVRDVTLLAVGWRRYGEAPRPWSRLLLRRLLSSSGLHSVRDAWTESQLRARGVRNVVNTACVTMWRLDTDRLARLPQAPARNVVTTVNAGHAGQRDLVMLDALRQTYETVHLWPQGIDDLAIASTLKARRPEINVLSPTLAAYDDLLAHGDIDFVGNRLHGGIRALQHNRRALILSVDNRAQEIARDTGLPVFRWDGRCDTLSARLESPAEISITLPRQAIEDWRAQFADQGGRTPG